MKMVNYNFVALPKIYRFLTGNELKVFVTIFDQWSQMKNEDGWYYRSQKQLCEDINLPLRTLQRTIKKLVEKGVILTTTYNDGYKMATYNKANEYKINMEKVVEMSEKKGVKMTTYKGVKSVKEGCQNGAPYKNKENKNKGPLDNVTKDTLQLTGVISDKHNVPVDTPNEDENNNFFNFISSKEETSGGDMDNNNLNKENEMSDERTNAMNAISEQSERQAKENESSGCVKENITSTLGNKNNASKDEHNVPVDTPNENKNNLTAPEQKYARWYKNGILVIQGKFYREPKEFIDKLKRNIDLAKSQMMNKDNYTKRENLINWEGQYDYMLTQLGNLRIFDEDEYLNYRKYVMKPWWNATKQFFPEGWEKIVKNHQK